MHMAFYVVVLFLYSYWVKKEEAYTLKKQVGCFNHRVVTLVAIMSGLCEVSLVLET